MTASTPTTTRGPAVQPKVRRITGADLSWALSAGWADFKDKRGDVILLALLYPLIGFLAAALAFNDQLTPIIFPLVTGLTLVGPLVACGFYEIARRRETGEPSGWFHFLDPVRGRSKWPLAVLTLLLVALFLAWLWVATMIYQQTLLPLHPVGPEGFVRALFGTPQGLDLILIGNLAGLGFAVVTLALTLVSIPMVVDKSVDPATAIATSLRAVARNPVEALGWGLRVAVLLVLGSIPAFLGLAIVLPVLGYATWHLYTRLVER